MFCGDGKIEQDARRLCDPREQERCPRSTASAGVRIAAGLPVYADSSAEDGIDAEQRPREFRAARADKARKPQDLSAMKLEADRRGTDRPSVRMPLAASTTLATRLVGRQVDRP